VITRNIKGGPRGRLFYQEPWMMNFPGGWKRLAVLAVVVLSLGAALLAVYWNDGSPDATGETEDLLQRLGNYFEKQPRDARELVFTARRLAEAERFAEAAQTYEKALALPSKVMKDPAVWCEYADALGMTQQGKLAGKPRELIDRALALNPEHPKALELAGSAEYELGNYDVALGFWRPLLALLKPGSQMHGELAAAIERTERLAAKSGQKRQ
jgi:cytochrome c-type biogenesis protein CcmH/NrfG